MANIKYTSTFVSSKNIEYVVQIHDLAYSGASTEIRLGGEGFSLNVNSKGDELYKDVVKATDLSIDIFVEDLTMETYLNTLIDRAEKTVYITILKDNLYYWGGVVLTDLLKFESASYPYMTSLKAIDYIGTLVDLPFNSENFRLLTPSGTYPVTTFFADILTNPFPGTGYFYLNSNELFSTASPMFETTMASNADVFEKTLVQVLAFTDDDNNFSLNYFQVLENLLITMGSKLMWSDGKFRIIDDRMNDYYTTWQEYVYDYDGNFLTKNVFDNSVAIEAQPSTNRIFLADPILEYLPALSRAEIILRSSPECRLDAENNPPSGYISNLSTIFTAKRDKLIYQLYNGSSFAPNLAGGAGEYLKIRFKANISQSVAYKVKWIYVIFEVQSGGTIYRLRNNSVYSNGINSVTNKSAEYTWGTNSIENFVILPYIGGDLEYTIITPALPTSSQFIRNDLYIVAGGGADITRMCFNEYTSDKIYLNETGIIAGYRVLARGLAPGTTISLYLTTNWFRLSNSNTYLFGAQSCDIEIPAYDLLSADISNISFDLNEISYINTPLGDVDNEGVIYNATNTTKRTKLYELGSICIGDQLSIANKSSIQIINSGSSQVYSNLWKLKTTYAADTGRHILQKLVENILNRFYKPLKKYDGILFTEGYEAHQVLIYKTESLIFIGGTFTASSDQWDGEWYVLQRGTTVSVSAKNTGVKVYSSDITKNIYPHIDVPILDNKLKNLWEAVGNLTTSVQVLNPVILGVSQQVDDNLAFDPVFTFQSTGSTAVVTNAKDGDIIVTNENGKFWKVVEGVAQEQFMVNKVEPQAPNIVYAGPTSGAAANPTFRAIVADDLGSGGSGANYLRGDMTWATMIAGVTAIGTIDSVSPKVANGAQISGSNLIMQTADSSFPGLVSIGTQTFAGAKTLSNNAHTSLTIGGTWISSGNQSHMVVNPNITADANSRILNAININPTMSVGGFTGVSLNDVNLNRNNPIVNFASGNLSLNSANTSQLIIRGGGGGANAIKLKVGQATLSGTVTNSLDVGGDSLFSSAQATPAAASARVDIVGSSASTGSALIVKNSTPTTLFEIKNNQDIQLGSSGGKIGLFAVTPIARPTTSIGSATVVSPGGGSNIKTDDTFDGYTIAKVVKALRDLGILT
jgi:hypothetical protein